MSFAVAVHFFFFFVRCTDVISPSIFLRLFVHFIFLFIPNRIMWQRTWLFDYCTRCYGSFCITLVLCTWKTTHCVSNEWKKNCLHLQIITINLALSPLPFFGSCEWRCLEYDRQKKSCCAHFQKWKWHLHSRKSANYNLKSVIPSPLFEWQPDKWKYYNI